MRTFVTRGVDHKKLDEHALIRLSELLPGVPDLAAVVDFVDSEKAISHKMGYQAGWKQANKQKPLPEHMQRADLVERVNNRKRRAKTA
jgi:hypothetical protein